MKPIDMKRTKAERASARPGAAPTSELEPEYPWGLSMNLEHESLEKLGMKGPPKAGATFHVSGRVKVNHSSTSDGPDGKRHSASLQVTHLALDSTAPGSSGTGAKPDRSSLSRVTRVQAHDRSRPAKGLPRAPSPVRRA